jgi:hypothetical protein
MSSNVSIFPASGRRISKSKASPHNLPLHSDERLVLETHLGGGDGGSPEVLHACDRLEVPQNVECTRLAAAVGQVLLHAVRARLPQWSVTDGGRVVFARPYRRRAGGQALAFVAQHLFTINWADSGPGLSWPEAYHLIYVPGYERWVVTASQDGDDAWGCTDQAIGFFGGGGERIGRAGAVIRSYWQRRRSENESWPWCYLFDEGLVSRETAEKWRQRVWTRAELRDAGVMAQSKRSTGVKRTKKSGMKRTKGGTYYGHTWDEWVQAVGYVGFSIPGRYFARPQAPGPEQQTQPPERVLSEQEIQRLEALLAAMREEGY